MLLTSGVYSEDRLFPYWDTLNPEKLISDATIMFGEEQIHINKRDFTPSRTNPDPYWYNLAFRGVDSKKRDIPLPITFVEDPNPDTVPIPNGAPTVSFGVVIVDATGYDNIDFHTVNHQALRMFQSQTNRQGSLILNNTVHYVDLKVLSGSPDCSSFIILYNYLITEAKVDFLFQPVNPNCTQLAFLAEAYGVPLINGPDFALTIYQGIPFLPFYSLTQTYSLSANYSQVMTSCLNPIVRKGAKTVGIVYAGTIGGSIIPAMEAAIPVYNLSKAIDNLILDNDEQQKSSLIGDGCGYVKPYIKLFKEKKPDILFYSQGVVYTEQTIKCMQRELYYPPAFWIFGSTTLQNTADSWMSSLSIVNDLWPGGTNTSDPLFSSVTQFEADYLRLWGTTYFNLVSYAATSATGGTIAIQAINAAQSTDPDLFRVAMKTLRFESLIGETYMVEGSQIFNHPFFCRQQGNGPTSNQTFVISDDTPNTVDAVYPADQLISRPQSFLDSLKHKSWWTQNRIAGIAVGASVFILIIIGLAGGFWYLERKYHFIFIPKLETNPDDEWQ